MCSEKHGLTLLSGIQNHCEPRNVLQVTKGRWSDSRSISAAQLVWINDHNYLLREVHHQYSSEPLLARRPHIAAQVRQAEKYCRPILYFRSMLLRNFILISEECTEFRQLWILQVKRNCIEIVLHWPEQVDMEWNSNKRLTKRKCKILMLRAIRLWLKDFFYYETANNCYMSLKISFKLIATDSLLDSRWHGLPCSYTEHTFVSDASEWLWIRRDTFVNYSRKRRVPGELYLLLELSPYRTNHKDSTWRRGLKFCSPFS